MAIFPGMAIPSQAGGFYDYEIDYSLRFEDGSSAYLSRTPASAGNRRTWTWSGWVKRGNLSSQGSIFGAVGSSNVAQIRFQTGNAINFNFGNTSNNYFVTTTQVFRDPSSWYHIVFVSDTTQATAANRCKIYINGVAITAFVSGQDPSGIPLNQQSEINTATAHYIGRDLSSGYFDGYLAEVHFIDGQALTPASFGEEKNSIWIPKEYSGSYGTNGFYLKFANSASLGADSSGNSNNFTPNNLSATDQMLDTPTNNWCTLNPVNGRESSGTYSEGNLKYVGGSDGHGAISSFAITHDCYAEFKFQATGQYGIIGIRNPDNTKRYTWTSTGFLYTESGYTGISTSTYSVGDIIGITVDYDGNIDLYKNNTLVRTLTATSYFAGHDMVFYAGGGNTGATWTANFGQDSSFAGTSTAQSNTDSEGFGEFYYSRASSYLALCTANLTVADAVDPAQDNFAGRHFNTVLWTGNGATSRTITGVGFQPDLVWHKARNYSYNHNINDAVRGNNLCLIPNGTNGEQNVTTDFSSGGVGSFVSDGFTLVSGTVNAENVNISGGTFVSWNWRAGNGTATNTNGSITSTVSANPDAGFSIATYGGNSSYATVGHGLSNEPEMVIVKARSLTADWQVYHTGYAVADNSTIELNTGGALRTGLGTARWDVSAFSSTVFGLGPDADTNRTGDTYVAYCFHSVEGYSKFGKYTGNGSSDGPFVYTGFRPAFVICKRTDSGDRWIMSDSKRGAYNFIDEFLAASASDSEGTFNITGGLDYLSNGFKARHSDGAINASSGSYIYMAFAEQPFKYANAR